jgi:hypothetical protein
MVWGLKVFVSHTCASIAFEGVTDDAKRRRKMKKAAGGLPLTLFQALFCQDQFWIQQQIHGGYLDSASDGRVSGSFLLA